MENKLIEKGSPQDQGDNNLVVHLLLQNSCLIHSVDKTLKQIDVQSIF